MTESNTLIIETTMNPSLFYIQAGSKTHLLKLNRINWLYLNGDDCTIYLEKGEKWRVRTSLKTLIPALPTAMFIRCHCNYVVNYSKIDVYDPSGAVQIEQAKIPVGMLYKQHLEQQLTLIN